MDLKTLIKPDTLKRLAYTLTLLLISAVHTVAQDASTGQASIRDIIETGDKTSTLIAERARETPEEIRKARTPLTMRRATLWLPY